MTDHPSVLCPIDLSEASRGALRIAGAISEHFRAELTVMTVEDPSIVSTAGTPDLQCVIDGKRRALEHFFHESFPRMIPDVGELRFEVHVGEAAPEILKIGRRRRSDVIVMSSHGRTGVRKALFGSTTERVLQGSGIPVLVTPAAMSGLDALDDLKRAVRRVLVPLDLTSATARQVEIAEGLADALDAQLVLAHVIQPIRLPGWPDADLARLDVERRIRADQTLEALAAASTRRAVKVVVSYGDPADEIARVAREHDIQLIVMGLRGITSTGLPTGTVTYRVLCRTHTMVLALPPCVDVPSAGRFDLMPTAVREEPASNLAL